MMTAKLFAVAAALALVAVGTSALTAEERHAAVAKLEAQLKAAKDAAAKATAHEAKERRAENSKPGVKVTAGNMKFHVSAGKRIGYVIGKDEVMFDDLAKTDTVMAEQVQAAYKSGHTAGEVGAKLTCNTVSSVEKDFADKVAKAATPLEEKLTAVEKALAKVEVEAKTSVSSDPVYWYDTNMHGEEKDGETFVTPGQSVGLGLTGVGFQSRFHPNANGQFACKFVTKDKKTSTSTGSIKAMVQDGTVYYHVECPTPALAKGAEVTVSLAEHDGKSVPFIGCKTCNTYKVDAMHTETKMVGNYPKKPTYTAYGSFGKGATYKCTFKGTSGEFSRGVVADNTKSINCGEGPSSRISFLNGQEGSAKLIIYSGSDMLKPKNPSAQDIKYYICDSNAAGEKDCVTGCGTSAKGGQAEFTNPGTYTWTANICGSVSVMAIGGGCGGGYQWSSGGGGGGGLGWIKKYDVTKGKTYKVVVGAGGQCMSNAGNTHATDGGTSYFVSANAVAGYGGGKGGPNAESSSPGYGGGYKGDGGGRGGRGGRGSWTGGGGGAGGYKGRGGNGQGCHNGNRNCDAPSGSGGGGGGGYYSSSWGTPAGGGVGLMGWTSTSGRGDWQRGGTGGSGGAQGTHGEPFNNGRSRCQINGGKYGGGGGGSGTSQSGGKGANGAVRIIWGPSSRVYPAGGNNV